MSVTDWIMGLGIMVGIAFFLTYITYQDLESFIIWLNVACVFMVYGGVLPLYILVVTLILLTIMIYLEFRGGSII